MLKRTLYNKNINHNNFPEMCLAAMKRNCEEQKFRCRTTKTETTIFNCSMLSNHSYFTLVYRITFLRPLQTWFIVIIFHSTHLRFMVSFKNFKLICTPSISLLYSLSNTFTTQNYLKKVKQWSNHTYNQDLSQVFHKKIFV